jgi:Ni,Fe-hydrogenase III small subunit/NAD-dependent dihydropyrimidine dehydrogenase PreA subunit
MLDLLKIRVRHGWAFVPDPLRASVIPPFRGMPELRPAACTRCRRCEAVCPSAAVTAEPLRIDLGRCVLCGDCQAACPAGAIMFAPEHRLAAFRRQALIVGEGLAAPAGPDADAARAEVRRLFGRSLKLRQVSAGGCNGCEMELGACGNVNFDMGRYGVEFVASPRHADGVVVTGPVSAHMAAALEDTWRAVPAPRVLVLAGSCAISGGVFAASPALRRDFFDAHPVDLYVPGCPPHPLTFIDGILRLLGRNNIHP